MSFIHILPEHVSNRIAAGEVVVRPSAVVKELIENALDAKATQVKVEIKKAGRELIRIVDDGIGMNAEDARMAFQRHATSKISEDKDLWDLNTYGFRGEALPSICSVAMVQLTTCQKDSKEGTLVCTNGGESFEVKPSPPVKGTQIDVGNLFFNTPARRKFLKNNTTEFSHIMETFINQSLMSLDVQFELIHDNKVILSLPKANNILERVEKIYGKSLAKMLFPINATQNELTLTGLISRPDLTKSNRSLQRFFINSRVVKDRTMSFAIQNVYANVLSHGRFPVCFLFLTLPKGSLDVNVHPTKQEVKFKDEPLIKFFVKESIKKGIDNISQHELFSSDPSMSKNSIASPKETSSHVKEEDSPLQKNALEQSKQMIQDFYQESSKKNTFDNMRQSDQYQFYKETSAQDSLSENLEQNPLPIKSAPSSPLEKNEVSDLLINKEVEQPIQEKGVADTSTLISQVQKPKDFFKVKNLFVVTSDENGIIVIDQHAAQERVMYERFLNSVQNKEKSVQELLVPMSLEISKSDIPLVESLSPAFESLGFQVEVFGEGEFLIRAIPSFVRETEVINIVEDILDDVREHGGKNNSLLKHFDELIATMACRASIKAGDKVSDIELSYIFDELNRCKDPHTCPHGRPTMIRLTFDELEKKFRRKKS
ncbi:hypothetical protein AB834_03390 [PVC group bacterium (ex Bugula neritina AB1)]|nr:hypothetical protein AB834_03390 [PVC group bacterium (ex Bugula neritina AB1)]